MRRSAAPSQANNNNAMKRSKFVPPVPRLNLTRNNQQSVSSASEYTISFNESERPNHHYNLNLDGSNLDLDYEHDETLKSVSDDSDSAVVSVINHVGIKPADIIEPECHKINSLGVDLPLPSFRKSLLPDASGPGEHQNQAMIIKKNFNISTGFNSMIPTLPSYSDGSEDLTHSADSNSRSYPLTKPSQAFKVPYKVLDMVTFPSSPEDADEAKPSYFSVVWCKLSKKKHKKWEGDAVLTTEKRSSTLYDLEGKVIGKATGYKVAELETLKEDETLIVGGKEVLVMSKLTEEHFKSGKCFTAAGSCSGETDDLDHKDKMADDAYHSLVSRFNKERKERRPDVSPPHLSNRLLVQLWDIMLVGDYYQKKVFEWYNYLYREEDSLTCTRFISISLSTYSRALQLTEGPSKPFVNPKISSSSSSSKNSKNFLESGRLSSSVCRYDASLPDALVMPRPSGQQQWKNNRQGFPVIDVVVDPYLSTSLRNHQRQGIVFLYECVMGMRDFDGQGAILADDMGLGKTLQCIALIWTLLKQGPYGKPILKKVLIVTPGSLVKNWSQEFKKWLGVERIRVFAVSTENKIEDYLRTDLNPVLIISYEMVLRCYEAIKNVAFDLIVCDEGHRLKNSSIKTTSSIMSLPCRRRVILTGTPIQNDLQEFYSIVEFCNPGVLGSSAAFRRVFEDPIVLSRQPEATTQNRDLGLDRAAELTRLTQMFVLRRTQEINNDYLSRKVELVLFCRASPLQHHLYQQLIKCNLIRQCLHGNFSGSPHLICIGALKQLCNHPGLLYKKSAEAEMAKTRDLDNEMQEESILLGLLSSFPDTFDPSVVIAQESGKLQVLSGILASIWARSNDEKVVLVSNHTKTLDFLQVFCNNHGYSTVRLDGQTPTAQRLDIVNRFNNKFSPHRIFLLSSKAGGVGLNLVGASRLILYDIDWNPANDLQAMARVWRDGQKKDVHIYRLLTAGTIEEKIYQRQIAKQGLSGVVMDVNNKSSVQFSVEELKAKSGNLSMAELLQWKHLKGKSGNLEETWCLDQAISDVTFLFWHESNSQKGAGS